MGMREKSPLQDPTHSSWRKLDQIKIKIAHNSIKSYTKIHRIKCVRKTVQETHHKRSRKHKDKYVRIGNEYIHKTA